MNLNKNKPHKWSSDTLSGFTIVELLIVIVVIGILAAISIVAYSGIQNRARATSLATDLANAAKQIELFHAGYGSYPAGLGDLRSSEFHDFRSVWNQTDDVHYTIIYCSDSDKYTLASRQVGIEPAKWVGIGSDHGLQDMTLANPTSEDYNTLCNNLGYPGTFNEGDRYYRRPKISTGWRL